MLKKILSNTQVFNSCFDDHIKDLYTNKANKKNCLIVHTYNNKKKNIMLMDLSNISKVS